MKKNLIILCILLAAVFSSHNSDAQLLSRQKQAKDQKSWFDLMQDPDAKFRDVQYAFYHWWEKRYEALEREREKAGEAEGEEGEEDGEVEGVGYQLFKRWEYINRNRVQADGKLPAPDDVMKKYEQYISEYDATNSASGNWTFVGMSNYPANNTAQPTGMGRVNAIAFHPSDPNIIFIGAPSGGIWKTNNPNGNSTAWTNLCSNLPTLGVSSILIHPSDPDIIYIGTGDRDGANTPGIGVYKTTNGGTTWSQVSNGMGSVTVGAMLMLPGDPNTIIAATSGGLFKTTNGGANWGLKQAGNFKDLKFKPGDPTVVYAARYSSPAEFYRSANTGDSWTKNTSLPSSGTGSRSVLGVSANNPAYVYVLLTKTDNTFLNLYRSTDYGVTFTAMASNPPNILSSNCDGSGTTTQATYDLCMAVDPANVNKVIVGGVDVWSSDNGGTNWVIKAIWAGNCSGTAVAMHADHHVLEWSPMTNYLYDGHDGGISFSTNTANTWTEITGSLPITQIYKIGQGSSNVNYIIFGTQDNGCNGTLDNSTFYTTAGGDGGESVIDYANSNYCYNTYVGGPIRRSATGPLGSYATIANNGLNGIDEPGDWILPYLLDKSDHLSMFAGYKNIWRSNNITSSPPSFTKISSGETNVCTVIEQSSADNNILFVVREDYWDGSQWLTGNVKRSDNARAAAGSVAWTTITKPGGNYPSDLKSHPTDANIVYATAGSKVYKSSDKGATWVDISGNLPAISINCLVYDKNTDEGIYIGNQTGVWYKNAAMPNWILFSNGLPPADVRELEIYYDANIANNKIKAGTFGRGLWQSDLATVSVIDPTGFAAFVAGSTQINLSWIKNAADNNVLVTWSPTETFGQPVDGSAYTPGNLIPGGGIVLYSGSASTFNHTGLAATTTYYYKIWSVDGSNQYSAGLSPIHATTDCPTITSLPYTCSFDNTDCWTIIDNTGNRSWQFGSSTNLNNPSTILMAPYAYFKSSPGSTVNYNSDLISPPLDLSALSNVVLKFNQHYDGDASWSSVARVYYTTDNGLNWNLLATYTTDQNNTPVNIVVPGAAGHNSVKFRWNYFDDAVGSYFWGIDDVEVKQCTGIWTGSISTNWHTAGNWCNNSVPTATTDVTIPAGATNMPDISTTTTAYCRDITIQAGATLRMSAANSVLEVKGNWNMYGSYDFNNSSTTSRVIFNGTSLQTIGGSIYTRLNRFTVNNASGVSVSAELRADNDIQLTNGVVTTTGNGKIFDVYNVITRTNGWVNGTLQKYLWSGTGSVENRTFQIGDANNCTPVSLSFPVSSITSTGPISMKTTSGDHPDISSSALDGSLSVNRFWSFPSTVAFTSCTATLNFISGDVDAGTITGNLIAGQYKSGTWSYPSTGTKTATSVQVTGLASATLGDLQLAESASAIDWANLQYPSGGTITVGSAFNVYAQVYEPGVTSNAGQGSGIQCWIGYSTTNTDPSTWTNWIPAAYNTDAGNNDEYTADLGVAISSAGTYYYASRFKRGSSAYVYGGFQGGFWNGTSNVSGTLTVNQAQLDWVNLQYPASATIVPGNSIIVYAQVYEPGITPGVGQGSDISAWIGYSASNDDPATGSGWTWVAAIYNNNVTGNNDEYMASIGSSLPAGTYYYASRFRLGTSPYVYGGLTGFWSSGNSGVLSVMIPTFTGTGNWTDAARWNTGTVPAETDNTVIDGTCTISSAVVTSNLTIDASRVLTLTSSGKLTVNGTLTNSAGVSGLIVESGGSIIENISGVAATLKRDVSKGYWHLIAVPNATTTAGNFMNDYLQYWDETGKAWHDIIDPGTGLNPIQGYGLWNESGDVENTFTGILNTGSFSTQVTVTGTSGISYAGANLLGNPYPCSVDWEGLRNPWGAVYYWNGTSYVSWNGSGDGSRYVPPMQGFFIYAPNAGTFSLSNANKAHSNTSFYKSADDLTGTGLVLATKGESYSDKLYITFNESAGEGFDVYYDAYKLLGGTDGVSEIYSLTGDTKLSIDVRPVCEMVPIGFANSKSGQYQVGIDYKSGILKATLEDTKNGTFNDLLQGNYSFSYQAGETDNRFKLHLATVGLPDNENSACTIYSVDKTVRIILPGKITGTIYLYNLAGQIIAEKASASGQSDFTMDTGGIYLVKVVTNNGLCAQKVWVR